MSPPSAVRSVISTYLHDTNSSVASASTVTATKKNSRVRMEPKYGENITSGNLLDELKTKAAVKTTKTTKRKLEQHSQNAPKKRKLNTILTDIISCCYIFYSFI